jgi:hypothetical protein
MKIVSYSLRDGNRYYGRIDGKEFFIGKRVSYLKNKGLRNLVGLTKDKYNRADYRDKYGFWADYLYPTAACEGLFYHTLNTYDKAKFTFTFLQFAIHVPNGDFIQYFRELLKLPLAKEYFPDLCLEDDRICKITDSEYKPLESDTSTKLLQKYFNPSSKQVEDIEIIQSAKMIHWVKNDPLHRDLQVEMGVQFFQKQMLNYAKRYNLDGVDDAICLVIADIRHQGRAKSISIIKALNSKNPLNSLLNIGRANYPNRVRTLRREINQLLKENILGIRKYSISESNFIMK